MTKVSPHRTERVVTVGGPRWGKSQAEREVGFLLEYVRDKTKDFQPEHMLKVWVSEVPDYDGFSLLVSVCGGSPMERKLAFPLSMVMDEVDDLLEQAREEIEMWDRCGPPGASGGWQ
jgi:hypothetical protein